MSLIRQALKKEAVEGEPSPPLQTGDGGRRKVRVSSSKMTLVFILLLILGGVLVYSFFPKILPFLKTPAPLPKPMAKQIALKPLKTNQSKEEAAQLKVSEKIESKAPLAVPKDQINKFPDQKPVKTSEIPPISSRGYLSPKPTSRIVPRFSTAPVHEAKSKGSAESPPPAQILSAQDETEGLQVVRLFNEAVGNQQKKLFPQAIQAYQEILLLRPNHWETYNNLGLIYQEQKKSKQALEMFQKALSLNPRYLKGFNNLGLYYLNSGKLEEAGIQFRKALDLDPSFLPAQINSAVVLNRQGQVEQARKILLRVLEYDPENPEAHYNLGLLWEEQGVESKALEHYKKFIAKAQGPYSALADELKKRWPELR